MPHVPVGRAGAHVSPSEAMGTGRPGPAAGDERWFAALEAVGATRGDAAAAFEELATHHAQGTRPYHHFGHAATVVDTVLSLHAEGDDWATAVLGGWFHDAVHNPGAPAGVNEGASAVLAVRLLRDLGAASVAIGVVARIVCCTADHRPGPGDRPGALLCDADLAVLAGTAADYDRYLEAIRAEYAHLDDGAWSTGRRRVLRDLLDRPSLFHTRHGQEVWEGPARTNISRELTGLS